MAIGDVDGDGRADIVLIVHDRVLVYRQDPGQARRARSPATNRPSPPKPDLDGIVVSLEPPRA